MKSKSEILNTLGSTGEERLLLAGLLDKEQTCETRGYLTHTKFLSMSERALCADAVRLCGATGHALFWGGYEDAERGIYVFYPDYLDEESAKQAAPLALLRAHKRKEDTLTHRDYLGALMGLQIDRSVVGDILVHEEGADILVLEEMAEFILLHFAKAGRKPTPLQCGFGAVSVLGVRLQPRCTLASGARLRPARGFVPSALRCWASTPRELLRVPRRCGGVAEPAWGPLAPEFAWS